MVLKGTFLKVQQKTNKGTHHVGIHGADVHQAYIQAAGYRKGDSKPIPNYTNYDWQASHRNAPAKGSPFPQRLCNERWTSAHQSLLWGVRKRKDLDLKVERGTASWLEGGRLFHKRGTGKVLPPTVIFGLDVDERP